VCLRPGARGHLLYRVRIHRRRKGERRSLPEADYAGLIAAAHHQLQAPVIVIWEYVARPHIPGSVPGRVMCPARLVALVTGGERRGAAAAGHIMLRSERGCFL
jgi:hypothetical protein